VLRHLLDEADLAELVQSIAASGYADFEPLVVWKDAGRLLVLEGNRRLAAIRLLSDPKLAGKLQVKVPEMAPGVVETLESVSIVEVERREDARAFIGFKHVNGPHRWNSYAKARFAANWYRDGRSAGLTLATIAAQMGDLNQTIPRMVSAIYVLDQAIEADVFTPEDKKARGPFAFSHLYTALTYPSVRSFLKLPPSWRADDPIERPVPEDDVDALQELLHWLYGSKRENKPPVVRSQNPDVKRLADVLSKPVATAVLRRHSDLSAAYDKVDEGRSSFSSHLVEAATYLEKALGTAQGYDGSEELFALFESAEGNVASLRAVMERRRKGGRRADG
jgi:hypothetical protein